MSSTVNEGAASIATIVPRDETGTIFTPTNFRYRLDDLATGTELIGWTSETPAASVVIDIPASANAIIDQTLELETKVLTIEFDHGTSVAHPEQLVYEVKNLYFIT